MIGSASGVAKEYAAVIFLFDFFEQSKHSVLLADFFMMSSIDNKDETQEQFLVE
jgi:hypothetical protein